ncbi:MAG TPA: hypothetical protein PKD55_21630 [Bellilinea sp.]|nr:hypothetical protein [Bellilinea sp.]
MLGLVVIAFIAAYLAVSVLVVWLTVRWAETHNRRPWVWGGLAAFAMYNLVFWDWIPTVAMHKYYCETEAGFWVYKTPEQWAKENPGVLETLEPYPNPKWGAVKLNNSKADKFNERFGKWDTRQESLGGLSIQRKEISIVDLVTQETLLRRVDFLSGPRQAGAVWKSWLIKDSCFSGEQRAKNYSAQHDIFVQLRMMEAE